MKIETTDPVCGMQVDESSPLRFDHEGTTYLFCAPRCRERFQGDPSAYLNKKAKPVMAPHEPSKPPQKKPAYRWKDYIPLMVIVALTLLAASAKQHAYGHWQWMSWMHDFMGLFLVVFSMFKFFNLSGFADGFQMYDLLAKPFRPWAYVYPFVELGLGLGYLAFWQPTVIYVTTFGVMVFGSLGVFNALRKKLDLRCACMGTVLQVPLSTVALVEDLGMAVMAAGMLIQSS